MDDHRIDLFEVIVLTLTIYILFSLLWQVFTDVNPEVLKLLNFFDIVACFVFLFDWFRRFRFAEKKWKFTLFNSLDLIASIPFFYMFDYVGYFKAVRLLRFFRIVKALGGINRLYHYFSNNKIETGKLIFSIFFMLIIVTGPILILYVEAGKGNIKTAEQALWWSYCTLTTIGYGDFYPTTTIGRILAVMLSTGGIGLFGVTTSILVNYLNEKNTDQPEA